MIEPLELTADERQALKDLLRSDAWKTVELVFERTRQACLATLAICQTDHRHYQGMLFAMAQLKLNIEGAAQPPNEVAAEREVYEHLRASGGREASGGY